MTLAKNILLSMTVVVLPLVLLRHAAFPYIWIFLFWIAICALLFTRVQTTNKKAVCVNLAVVFATLLGVEIFAIQKTNYSASDIERNYQSGYHAFDSWLGYRPNYGVTIQSDAYVGGEFIYDVTYTINQSGLRIGPPIDSKNCILFFGGSYMFGEGVNDDETLPWLTGAALNIETFNFGFHGYGPHQMLANIESGRVAKAIDCQPVAAIYLLLNPHIYRSGGLSYWDKDGPKYELDNNGHAIYQGPFRADESVLQNAMAKVDSKFAESIAYQYFVTNRYRTERQDEQSRLLAGIVATAKTTLESNYPGILFIVLHWDDNAKPLTAKLQKKLLLRDIDVQLLGDHMPDFRTNRDIYRFPHDGHPNAAGQAALAEFTTELLATKLAIPAAPL
jgi:hypothetical protein